MKRNGTTNYTYWILIIAGFLAVSVCETDAIGGDSDNSKDAEIPENNDETDTGDLSGQADASKSDTENKPPNGGETEVKTGNTDSNNESKASNGADVIRGEDKPSDVKISESDELVDTPQIVDDDSIGEESYYQVHTVRLMLYIIAPVGALVVIYFVMKTLKGNSRQFFNRYQIVGARADNIELRPLGYESDEEDIVFDVSTRN